ncbi:Proline--tRNA ligase [Gossypium arboreum]|uniref:Proline--tRNA ligase n=1 Tax=Gossypium arboreum TaxID=29729 RepID=A0A0B0NJ38_GOSAR|nr:Proline--tRNA ligase [Gossypium arboreum]
MHNFDLSELSELSNLYKKMEKKQGKLYSLVSSYNSKFNLPFIHNQTIKQSISNSLSKCYTQVFINKLVT